MKKLIILAVFTFGMLATTQAQTINGLKIENLKTNYIELICLEYRSGPVIYVNYGQNFYGDTVLDKEGKPIKFKSSIEALNFFSKYGYDLIAVNNLDGYPIRDFYYLRRKPSVSKNIK